jgi:uncharacterized protein (DUF433 family)
MSLAIISEPPPLQATPDGVIRVGGTRVTLDSVVAAYREGATAEEIVEQYPTLQLRDVYSVFGYFLRHEDEVNAYLERRRREADDFRRENERRFPPQGIRERLNRRREKRQG